MESMVDRTLALTGDGSDPPVQAIDGADLDALLAKFGGHP